MLLLFSLVFYGWGEPKLVFLMIFTIALFYLCGLAIGRAVQQRWKKFWLWVSVAVSLGLLGLFKYADFFLSSVNTVTGMSLPLLKLALPVGISFYTFQCLSYTIDVYRGNAEVQRNPISFGAYVTLFPQLIAGPIVRYVDVARELEHRHHSWENLALGLRRFLVGLGKKVILADNFALLIKLFRESGEPSVLFYWMYAVAFLLNIYFDFSGYSDMAIGLGRIFGFHFLENFNYPYLSGLRLSMTRTALPSLRVMDLGATSLTLAEMPSMAFRAATRFFSAVEIFARESENISWFISTRISKVSLLFTRSTMIW